MRVYRQTSVLTEPCVATIGNFDGMHLGHQSILKALQALARQQGLPSMVIIFEPQPSEYFLQEKAAARLMRLREKLLFLQGFGIDRVTVLRFDQHLATLSAESFVKDILRDRCRVEHLFIGDDFRFGYQRAGDYALLQDFARQGVFSLTAIASYQHDGRRVSSTLVRTCLQDNQLTQAADYLGRPFCVTAKVIHGQARGRLLNFPTINMNIHRRVSPLRGVYVVQVTGVAGHGKLNGVANLGCRPTVDGQRWLLETHLLTFDQWLYGQTLTVEFHHKLRDEAKFSSLDALQQQIQQDVTEAQQFFTNSS